MDEGLQISNAINPDNVCILDAGGCTVYDDSILNICDENIIQTQNASDILGTTTDQHNLTTESGHMLLVQSDGSTCQNSIVLHSPVSGDQLQYRQLLVLSQCDDKNSYEASVLLSGLEAQSQPVPCVKSMKMMEQDCSGELELSVSHESDNHCKGEVGDDVRSTKTVTVPVTQFKKAGSVLMHEEKDESGVVSYICDVEKCGRQFKTAGILKYHQMAHQQQKVLKCNYGNCNRKFFWPSHFKYHQMTHTGERSFHCIIQGCNKSFFTAQRLEVHIRSHTGTRPFRCQEDGCNKSFTTAGNLKNHERVHTGERPYHCKEEGCGRSFAEYSSLKKHALVHSGIKPYSCSVCGKLFSQSGSRNVHIKHHHGDGKKVTSPAVAMEQSYTTADSVIFSSDNNHIVIVATKQVEPASELIHTLQSTCDSGTENTLFVESQASLDTAGVVVMPENMAALSVTL